MCLQDLLSQKNQPQVQKRNSLKHLTIMHKMSLFGRAAHTVTALVI